MVVFVPDKTGRFSQRPHYQQKELDVECERIITDFLRQIHGTIEFPVITDDLTKLIEQDADSLDMYADLSHYGADVEGVTEFLQAQKPIVRISKELTEDEHRENRLRTTLTHEYGHVKFHAYLWKIEQPGILFRQANKKSNRIICKREKILNAPMSDWMEWQAGYTCGALLMPLTPLTRLVIDYKELNDLYGVVKRESYHGQALIREVMSFFQVSADAARVRLSRLRLIGETDDGPSLFS